MPVYDYEAASPEQNCPRCAAAFEVVQSIHDERLTACPSCGAPIRRIISAPAIGRS